MFDNFENLQLNEPQKEAVTHNNGPLLVLAGAGTGKTRVLTCRIAYLLKNGYAHNDEILAVTFTNKASREMHERINKLCGHNISGMTIGTFHSIAAKILRVHAELLGLTRNFSIIDADDQLKLIKQLLESFAIDTKEYPSKLIANIISRWKDMGLAPEQISESDIKTNAHHIARKIYTPYQLRLLSSNACDFGDLLLYNNKIFFDHHPILESYQKKFKYILIDEYQDTNPVQYLWARMLAGIHKNICCVGDDDQSIYSWRGAEVGNILRFERDFPGAKIIKLEQNYRSTTPILTAAASLIKNNIHRHNKTLWTSNSGGEPINIVSCYNEKEEARFIANYIQNIILNGQILANDIAILVRAGFQTRAFEEAFIAYAIPYKMIGGLKFYERAEIKDSLAYIRLVINNNDDLAFERIINTPKRAIGPSTINAIRSSAHANNCSMLEATKIMLSEDQFKPKVKAVINLFVEQVLRWNQRYKTSESPTEVTKSLLEESGYLGMWRAEKTEEARSRLDNIQEMLRAINEFGSIEEFIEHTSLVMDKDDNVDSSQEVNIMTLHAGKGLEFHTVFLPGMEEGLFPHQKSLNEEGTKGLEEERRIAYVGITRAKHKLIMSYAESRRIFNEFVNSTPSRFILELPEAICVKTNSSKFYYNSQRSNNIRSPLPKEATINYKQATKEEPFRPGVRVNHVGFGNGIIIKKNSDNLEIFFDSAGLKTIKQNFVQLI